MGKVDDILMDENGEDRVVNGDDEIGDATEQNQKLLIMCRPGENSMDEDSGVGIDDWILDEAGPLDLKRTIQSEFEADGMTMLKLEITKEKITTQATYGN